MSFLIIFSGIPSISFHKKYLHTLFRSFQSIPSSSCFERYLSIKLRHLINPWYNISRFSQVLCSTGFGIIPRRGRMQLSATAWSEVKGPGGIREIHLWETDEPEVSQNSRPRQSLGHVPGVSSADSSRPAHSLQNTRPPRDTHVVKISLRTI